MNSSNQSQQSQLSTSSEPQNQTQNKPQIYRLSKIEINKSDCINKIKFTYDDKTVWNCGQDDGKSDPKVITFTQGEYLKKVQFESLYSLTAAGSGIIFYTNKGREFKYLPYSATKRLQDQTIMEADEGQEILSLKIQNGILKDIVTQKIDKESQNYDQENNLKNKNNNKEWYSIVTQNQKEQIEDKNEFDIITFDCKNKALQEFYQIKKKCQEKKGRNVLLIDTKNNFLLKQFYHSKQQLKQLKQHAVDQGVFTYGHDDEKNVGIVKGTVTLIKLLGNKKDFFNMMIIFAFLAVSEYFEVYTKMLAGHVLGSFNIVPAEESKIENIEEQVILVQIMQKLFLDYSLQQQIIIAFICAQVLHSLTYVINVWLHHNQCEEKNSNLKVKAFSHVINMDQEFFDQKSIPDITGSMNVHSINNQITWNIPYLISRIIKLSLIILFMAQINLYLTLKCVFIQVIFKFVIMKNVEKYEKIYNKIQHKFRKMNDQSFNQALNMINSIKLFSQEKYHVQEYSESQDRYKKNLGNIVFLRCLREFLEGIFKIVVFGFVLLFITKQNLSSANITSFYLLFEQIQSTVNSLNWHFRFFTEEFPDIERFLELMEQKSKLSTGHEQPDNFKGQLELKNVSYEYPTRPGQQVINDLSVKFKLNQITAIVGDSGAGKSTVSNLLMRIYDPKQGKITLDDYDIKSLDLGYLHEQITIVNQNPALFSTSIRNNIAYGAKRQVTEEEIIEAAKLANCWGFIQEFRAGLDTMVGDRGAQLSGGQKQRIAIARAAICNPKILILDEATAALDAENEKLVQEALERIMKDKSIIIIAHRLSTIKNAQEILCMKSGKIIEKGSHEELMKLEGNYYNLIKKQL